MQTRLEDVLKTSWRGLGRRLKDVLKTTWRRLEDVLGRRIANTSWWRLEDVFKRSWKTKCYTEDVFKTSWRRLGKQEMFAGLQTSLIAFKCLKLSAYIIFTTAGSIWHSFKFLLLFWLNLDMPWHMPWTHALVILFNFVPAGLNLATPIQNQIFNMFLSYWVREV